VVLLEEDLQVSSVEDRIAGFRAAVREHDGVEKTIVRVPTRRRLASALPWGPSDAYRIARRLIRKLARGTAIIVGSDYFALGVYRALLEAGRTIPDDVAVMGYGDHPFAAYLEPPLSSVHLPSEEVGATAVDFLLRQVSRETSAAGPQKVCLDASLVVRSSTARRLN